MLTPRLAVALLGAVVFVSAPQKTLRVLRHAPAATASPVDEVLVTFDRPVAGSLDQSIDASRIFTIEPAVRGRLEWRDPVTIVFTPDEPLAAATRYTVRIADAFAAMDGSRLASPYTFSFRVRGPIPISGSPAGASQPAVHLPRAPRFEVVFSGPVDGSLLASTAYIEMARPCSTERVVRLQVLGQRAVAERDPWQYRSRDWREPERTVGLRRVLTLAPASDLPLDCAGELVLPSEVATGTPAGYVRWPFRTYGPLRLSQASCGQHESCPTGPVRLVFNTPVRGSDVLRHVRLHPATAFSVADSSRESDVWVLDARLEPRTTYAVTVDTAMRDVFRQRITGNPAAAFATTGYAASVSYPFGRLLVERRGFGTLAVQHVNVDTLLVTVVPVPDSLEASFLRRSEWSWGELWNDIAANRQPQRIPVRATQDRPVITGVRLPATTTVAGRTLYAVRISHPRARPLREGEHSPPTIALVQVTDLAVHAKVGAESGIVWVTGVNDGQPRRGASITLSDSRGAVLARATSDSTGIARFPRLALPAAAGDGEGEEHDWSGFEGMVAVTLGDDRAVIGISAYDQDLSAWRFNVRSEWGARRLEAAGAAFTERGIYRPGEDVHVKAIVRTGPLGALAAPAAGDSARWVFFGRDGEPVQDTVVQLSAFGTSDRAFRIPEDAGLGSYAVSLQYHRRGSWVDLARASYRVAEYRPPEFLVDVMGDDAPRFAGDSVTATIQARYLFGAPMSRAVTEWRAVQTPLSPWAFEIPNTDGFVIGETGRWWEDGGRDDGARLIASGVDTLDAAGARVLRLPVGDPVNGRVSRVAVISTVTDVNRQTVSASAAYVVHPAAFYIGARPLGSKYFWTAGEPEQIGLIAVRPTGERVTGVRVSGTIVRREWHQVRRERNGISEVIGEWVSDTVGTCAITTRSDPVSCAFTPPAGGSYILSFTAADPAGRTATTSMYRWASGRGWIPWSDESRFTMDLIPDRQRYSVGDTATVMIASPFTDAEAWMTVEREGILEQRRFRLADGATTLRIPITEAHVPNAFVSVIVTRGRSASPGRLDDPGRPTMRVGYAELRVTPEVKRLAVEVQPLAAEYRPGDTAQVRLRVRDGRGSAQRAEVALWAVDEGVLALTGYRTPDPLDLIYQARGLGMRLASNLVSLAPQIPEGEKGSRAPGGGGGGDGGDVLRSQFRTTAFFLGSVVTDANGEVVASANLPDNITTFRVMAVAVTNGDRYGSGQSPMLVTRPLIARPALPRFVRPGDELVAGTVVNRRGAGGDRIDVRASATGIELRGSAHERIRLQPGAGQEVRFGFRALPGDSAAFRFDVAGGGDADAVRISIPIRPDFHPRAHTIAGVVRDSAIAEFVLPADMDAARSTLSLSLGSSPLTVVRGMRMQMRVYAYYCTEQVLSITRPLIAMYRATGQQGSERELEALRREIEGGVRILQRRQREDGGIGYWGATDWSTPWLSAYAATVLLDAREAGFAVSDSALARVSGYLTRALNEPQIVALAPVALWYERRSVGLAEQVAAVDVLSRMGRPHLAAENRLFATAPQLAWEDRLRLGEVLARRGAAQMALHLIAPAWAQVRIEGRKAVLPDSAATAFYFTSTQRPTARLLTATLAVNPDHPLVGPLVETLVDGARGSMNWFNTQDYAAVVEGLLSYQRQAGAGETVLRARSGGRTLLEVGRVGVGRDSVVPLTGLLTRAADGQQLLRVAVDARSSSSSAFYYLTVTEIPRQRPVTPSDDGIRVERWYEHYDHATPTVSAVEGDLVRVRVRITVPSERYFVVLDDALPAGLEAVDLSLRTVAPAAGPGGPIREEPEEGDPLSSWRYGRWDSGWWSPFEHREIRDDRVVYFATVLWPGTYTVTYVARATTPGVFIRPPAHAEEMYNPAVNGRSDGGVFTVRQRSGR